MGSFLARRTLHSALALVGLVVLVFFLSRLTGDPTNLYLPIDASIETREAFAEKHGFRDPVLEQFGRFVVDLTPLDLGQSVVAMSIAILGAVVVGSLAAYRPGGVFDRVSSVLSLAGASAPDFWVAITGILLFLMVGLLALVIALLTVGYQAVKEALINPVRALRYE